MSQPSSQPAFEAIYKTPRWIKISGIVALIFVVLLAVMLLSGEHGPGRHLPADVTQDGTPAANATSIHTSPVDHEAAQP